MPDPYDVAMARKSMQQAEEEDTIVQAALRKRKRKPRKQQGQAKKAMFAWHSNNNKERNAMDRTQYFPKLAALSKTIPCQHNAQYGKDAAPDFKPSVRMDTGNGWTDSKKRQKRAGWPGLGNQPSTEALELGGQAGNVGSDAGQSVANAASGSWLPTTTSTESNRSRNTGAGFSRALMSLINRMRTSAPSNRPSTEMLELGGQAGNLGSDVGRAVGNFANGSWLPTTTSTENQKRAGWQGLMQKEAKLPLPALLGLLGAGVGGLGGAAYGALAPGEDKEGKKRNRWTEALGRGLLGAGIGGGVGAGGGALAQLFGGKGGVDSDLPGELEDPAAFDPSYNEANARELHSVPKGSGSNAIGRRGDSIYGKSYFADFSPMEQLALMLGNTFGENVVQELEPGGGSDVADAVQGFRHLGGELGAAPNTKNWRRLMSE